MRCGVFRCISVDVGVFRCLQIKLQIIVAALSPDNELFIRISNFTT